MPAPPPESEPAMVTAIAAIMTAADPQSRRNFGHRTTSRYGARGQEITREIWRASRSPAYPTSQVPSPWSTRCFPNLLLLGSHIQVFQPISFKETDSSGTAPRSTTWTGRSERMYSTTSTPCATRYARRLPEFWRGGRHYQLRANSAWPSLRREDEWIYMHRGLGIPGRIKNLDDGTIKGPATDELFMREYIREWKRLMKAEPDIAIRTQALYHEPVQPNHDLLRFSY